MSAEIIRSLVRQPNDPSALIYRNIQSVRDASVEFSLIEDSQIWAYVDQFAKTYDHAPEVQTVTNALRAQGQTQAADRLESILTSPLRTEGDFFFLIEEICEQRRLQILDHACRDARIIAHKGLEIGQGKEKKTLRGSAQAASYLADQIREVSAPTLSGKLSGEIIGDAEEISSEYLDTELNPRAAFGQYSGIQQMDEALGGARVGELWIHAAFSGHLKTTLALNWAYNQSIWFHENILYFSLEMPYRQVRRWIIAMHSYHHKFRDVRIALGLQVAGGADVGLDYKKIRDAQLGPIEKQYLLDYVVPDLKNPENGYGRIIVETADPDKPDITVDALKGRAETIYPKTPFSMMYIDHASLLGSRSKYNSTTDRLNEAMKDLKRLALHFRRGQGIPVVALFQINREGLKEALKRKEKGQLPTYEITSLSYANEAERSADVVTATYLDKDYADRERALLTCLKARDNAPFQPSLVEIVWPCRRILSCVENPNDDFSTKVDTKQSDILDTLNGVLK